MSFGNFARKARDPALTHQRRASALGSCVQLYRPLGYQATLYYLNAKAGPIKRDETALLEALALLETSRALWQEDIGRYDVRRREAKRQGRRVPRPTEGSPFRPAHWYGAPREAALCTLRFWREHRFARLAFGPRPLSPSLFDEIPPPENPDAPTMLRLMDTALAAEGDLSRQDMAELDACVRRLRGFRPGFDVYREYEQARDLLQVAGHIRTAAGWRT